MKSLKKLVMASFFILISSCTVSEKNWHEAASKINGQSIYISKDGVVSANINNKLSSQPNINLFDSKSADIAYAAITLLYKKHRTEYESNSNKFTNVYILDLRDGLKNPSEYEKIISDGRK